MTLDELAEMIRTRMEAVIEEMGEEDTHAVSIRAIGLDEDVVNVIAEYVSNAVSEALFNHSIAHGGGMTPNDVVGMTIGVCLPTTLLAARCVQEKRRESSKYMATVGAELALSSMISENRNLSDVWPAEYVSEITQVFPEPTMAFLAGVMCGERRG